METLKDFIDFHISILSIIELHTFLFICQLFLFFAIIAMVAEKQKPTGMIAWILAILFVPYIAVPFYFIFGMRKRKSKWKKDEFTMRKIDSSYHGLDHDIIKIFVNEGIPQPTINNSFELYTNGIDAYQALADAIDNAQQSIDISTYVFQNDQVTQALVDKMIIKAKQGVKVRLLIDALGSYKLYFRQKPIKKLRKAGASVQFFMPIFKMPFRNYINFRNHRKIYLFDQTTVLTGGMNLGNEYLGPEPCEQRWDDLLFKIQGDAVCHFYNIFASDWEFASKEKLEPMCQLPSNHRFGESAMQVVPSGPDIPTDTMYDGLLAAIYSARKRVWIVTPYFVPSDSLYEALVIAHNRGVDVTLITPRYSNHTMADLARSGYMRKLEKMGVKIALFDKMIHAKAVLFDDQTVMLGSVNIDNRSLFLNYEIATFAYQPAVIEQIEIWMQSLISQSSYGMKAPSRGRKFSENMIKCMVPLL